MIHFDEAGLDSYLADDRGGPVVMLNLLRFHPDGGAEKYMDYVQRFSATGINEKYGLRVLYAGQGTAALVAEDGQDWDMVALVQYPDRQHFVDMVRDPTYREFEHLRTAALLETVLQPTVPAA
ncbi:DUF1330 domain-containing protein [Rhodococcus sp. G-MC3]|uniref:DUF1330 domain-containing protein n=1 Tax=Rhodococcus sp. G-MC3 TaxID=3046209 RepID=UPI0024BA112D|nr:DUF1330 domain-containing protein [Rhodococcus sp. G-MC3]MDJ0394046.1 DUF1330 domain-containing protein [Rhodococcus sp. G-MC3]